MSDNSPPPALAPHQSHHGVGAVAQSELSCEDLLSNKPVKHFSAFFHQL